jgi:NHLM bacteriocin system ABC transporter peptidase/ATP-binding protein
VAGRLARLRSAMRNRAARLRGAGHFQPESTGARPGAGEEAGEPAAPPGAPRRVRTPTILQMEAVECGAAALAMVLARHGRWVPLEELRAACGVSRDGSKANNMLRAARAYGLVAKGYKQEPNKLVQYPMPMIVHWNFNHFVVLEGFRGDRAYLNDPAAGPTVISAAEFDQSFTGVALVFEPGPDFRSGGERPSLAHALRRRLLGAGAAVSFMLLVGLALVVPGVVTPTFQKVFVDSLLVQRMSTWLAPLLLLMGATAAVTGSLVWMQQHYLLRFEAKLALQSSSRFVWHALRLPITFYTQRYAGDVGGRITLNDRVARLLAGDIATTLLNLLVVVFYAVLMFQYDVVLTSIGVATAVLNIAALRFVSRRRVDQNARLMQDRGRAMGAAMGGLQTIETLKATGGESDFFVRWAGHQAKVSNGYHRLQLTTQLLSAVPPALLAINTALVIGIGGTRVMEGHLSMGMLAAFQSLMLLFLTPVNRMVALGSTLQEVGSDMNRLDDVLRARIDPVAPSATLAAVEPTTRDARLDDRARLTGAVELRGVTFGYSRLDPPLIHDFDLVLHPGSRVALVGGSGSGKTTIAKLVTGLYQPWVGEILFDGQPREAVPRPLMHASLAVVDQDIFLFEDTVKENMTLWDATVTEAALVQAARDACIHDELAVRQGGYGSRVEEGGRNFSGGQRQRMEIARALVGDPSILVLDEATSALDAVTEQRIDDQLRRRGCTCLIVAHRLSTIRDCDEIIVLERGKVVQRGTHEQLAAVPGAYRTLVQSA